MDTKALFELYTTTHFVSRSTIPYRHFAVITAFNPQGKLLPATENDALHSRLQQYLQQNNIPHQVIRAGSPDFSHVEMSFVVFTSKQQAKLIAVHFEQNAYFYIDDDQLYLLPAMLTDDFSGHMGLFSSRLTYN